MRVRSNAEFDGFCSHGDSLQSGRERPFLPPRRIALINVDMLLWLLLLLALVRCQQPSAIPHVVSLFSFERTLTSSTWSVDALRAADNATFVNGAAPAVAMGHNNDVMGDSVRLGTKLAAVVVNDPPLLGPEGVYFSMWLKLESTSTFPMKLVSSFEGFSVDMTSRRLLSIALASAINVGGPRDADFRVFDEWMFLLIGFHRPSMTVLRAFIDAVNVRFDAVPVTATDGWGPIPLCMKPYVIGANLGANTGKLSDGPIGLIDDVARFDVQTVTQQMTPELANAIADGTLFLAVLSAMPTNAFTPRTGTLALTTTPAVLRTATRSAASASAVSSTSSTAIYIAVGIVLGVLFLLGVLIAVVFVARSRRRSRQRRDSVASAMYPSQAMQQQQQAMLANNPSFTQMTSARSPTVSGPQFAPSGTGERSGTLLADSLPSIDMRQFAIGYQEIALPSQAGYMDVGGGTSAQSFVPQLPPNTLSVQNLAYNDLPASYKAAYSNVEM